MQSISQRLIIWTGAKADVVREALQPAFDRLSGPVPENATIPFEDDILLEAEAGDVVLAMGNKCLKLLQQHKLCHGGLSLNTLRQTPIVGPKGGVYLITLDPFMVRTQADAPSLIRQDVALAVRLALTGSTEPPMGKYRLVETFEELLIEVDRRLEEDPDCFVELACDTETLGLRPEAEGARLITIQFTLDEGSADVLKVPEDGKLSDLNWKIVDWLLTHPRILLCGANWKYDSRWIYRHWGIQCTNLSRDSLLMGSLVDENRSNSLKTHAWEYTLMGGYDRLDELGYDKGRMDLVPDEHLVPYAGADTDVTLQSARKIKNEMGPALVRLYRNVSLPASSAFEAMEHEGVYIDEKAFAELRVDLTTEMAAKEKEMLELIPARLKMKYADKIKSQLENDKSPLTPNLLKDYFFTPYGLNLKPKMVTEKTQEPSTAKAHLSMFFDVPEAKLFVDALEAHGSASKTRSTFVDGFLKHKRADGRLHPSYMLFAGSMFGDDDDDAGTVTGRTSCKEPAFQTIPKKTKWAKRLRACYPAPPGDLMCAFDFSQGELKVVACVAEEQNMLAAFEKGMDLHGVTAAAFMGITYEEFKALEQTDLFTYTLMRTAAKAGNFGLLYGMQVPGFQKYARDNYGVTMTMGEAEERRNAFFTMYPGLLDYHKFAKEFARANGYVESPLGRRRNLPLIKSPDQKTRGGAELQAINAPIQSTLNELALYAAGKIKGAVPQLRGFGMVHDQLLYYGNEDVCAEAAHAAKEVMDNLPIKRTFGWAHQLQFTSDGEIGPRMNALAKL